MMEHGVFPPTGLPRKYGFMVLMLGLLLSGVTSGAWAANWFALQNNEAPNAAPYTFWGFVQPQYVHHRAAAVNGLSAPAQAQPYNGQVALFNQVAPDANRTSQFQILRARAGVRGVVPETGGKINYFLLTEFGNNGLTRENSIVVTDASLNFSHIPGARVRVGLGRLPLGEEALQGIQVLDYINFTNATDQLLNERFVSPYATARPTAPVLGVPMGSGRIVGAVSAFQDTGVEVYDWFTFDKLELSYAAMLSNGNGINFSDSNGKRDLTLHFRAAHVFGGAGPRREEAAAYIWHQEGARPFSGSDYMRIREGAGFRYLRNGLRISGEYLHASGVIFIGPSPPFNDVGGGAFEPVTLMALESSNKADGHYLEAGWKVTPQWEADLRYDRLNRLTNSAFDERTFTTWTVGGQYFHSPALRFAVNYEIRTLKVPHPDAAGLSGSALAQQIQSSNAVTIANTMGNRLSVQLTYIF